MEISFHKFRKVYGLGKQFKGLEHMLCTKKPRFDLQHHMISLVPLTQFTSTGLGVHALPFVSFSIQPNVNKNRERKLDYIETKYGDNDELEQSAGRYNCPIYGDKRHICVI